jgi:hypothetical protein
MSKTHTNSQLDKSCLRVQLIAVRSKVLQVVGNELKKGAEFVKFPWRMLFLVCAQASAAMAREGGEEGVDRGDEVVPCNGENVGHLVAGGG